jgi:hypothetical protein
VVETLPKSVKVHDDTHRVLKLIKGQRRSRSIDEVIREMIRGSTGVPVEKFRSRGKTEELTRFIEAEES